MNTRIYSVAPLQWSGPSTPAAQRRLSPFTATIGATHTLLLRELRQLSARSATLQMDVRSDQIRLDGGLYANATPATPALRLVFDSRHGPMAYACDRFTRWQDNLRAIALGLEALRRVDRYGISQSGEQYTGYLALGPGSDPSMMDSLTSAAAVLAAAAGWDKAPAAGQRQQLVACWKAARAAHHPDRVSGDRTMWDRIERAAVTLGLVRRMRPLPGLVTSSAETAPCLHVGQGRHCGSDINRHRQHTRGTLTHDRHHRRAPASQ